MTQQVIDIIDSMNDDNYYEEEAVILKAYIERIEKEYESLDYKFSCVLDNATGGRASKSNIDLDMAYKLINDHINFWVESALEELKDPKRVSDADL